MVGHCCSRSCGPAPTQRNKGRVKTAPCLTQYGQRDARTETSLVARTTHWSGSSAAHAGPAKESPRRKGAAGKDAPRAGGAAPAGGGAGARAGVAMAHCSAESRSRPKSNWITLGLPAAPPGTIPAAHLTRRHRRPGSPHCRPDPRRGPRPGARRARSVAGRRGGGGSVDAAAPRARVGLNGVGWGTLDGRADGPRHRLRPPSPPCRPPTRVSVGRRPRRARRGRAAGSRLVHCDSDAARTERSGAGDKAPAPKKPRKEEQLGRSKGGRAAGRAHPREEAAWRVGDTEVLKLSIEIEY